VGKYFSLSPEVARAIAQARPPKVRQCRVCGKEFTTIARGLYCSARCKKAAYRARVKERTYD
jgi:hypothetical protein